MMYAKGTGVEKSAEARWRPPMQQHATTRVCGHIDDPVDLGSIPNGTVAYYFAQLIYHNTHDIFHVLYN